MHGFLATYKNLQCSVLQPWHLRGCQAPLTSQPIEGQLGLIDEETVLKICVLGAGALGCAFGGVLTEAGNEVWLVNRGQAHVDAMRQQGLTMRDQGVDRVVPVRATTDCREIAATSGPMDLIIMLVKSFHTAQAIAPAACIVGERTVVLSLQNGLGHEDVLADAVGRDKVLAGKTYVGGLMLGPGHITIGTRGKDTHIGELDGHVSERAQRIAQVFNSAGLETQVSDNIMGTMWDKLLINVATGALTGITGLTYGEFYAMPELEACSVAAVKEAMAVAHASGIRLGFTNPRDAWAKAGAGLPYEFKTSMLQSLEKGSVTEIDFVNGAVVAQGLKLGVPTPVNQALVACMKGVERAMLLAQSRASAS
jgi:2-dehydropantoate 2-reductase